MKVQCKICNNATNHEIVVEHKTNWDEDYVWGADYWQTVKCLGCGDVTFRHCSYFSEDTEPDGTPIETEKLYPPRGKDILVEKDFYTLSETIKTIYSETIECYNIQARVLCAAGIRAIIEGICQNEGIISGTVIGKNGATKVSKNLDGKISGLMEKNIITKRHSDVLHELRFLGNYAVHELKQPSSTELQLAIEIIEHTIESLYEIEEKANGLRQASMRRQKTI